MLLIPALVATMVPGTVTLRAASLLGPPAMPVDK